MEKKETFRSLIAANRRNSTVLIGVMIGLFVAVGAIFGEALFADYRMGLIIGGIVAVIMVLFAWAGGESAIMGINGAQEIAKEDCPKLFNVVEEMSLAAGVPMPRVYIIETDCPNAFATGPDPENAAVAITTGLYEKLSRDELQGVIAHEMAHIRNFDIRYSMLMAVLAGGIVMLSEIFLRMSFFATSSRRRDDRDNNSQIIFMVIGIVLAILAPILTALIQMAMSREREYLADASAVEFTRNPDGLANALAKLAADTEPMEYSKTTESMFIVSPALNLRGGMDSLFSTHPPIEERIRRLRELR
ncbi:MAG: M48 family metalloprotease [Lentisphaeria bacterium]|nr:M48 family metalloprotease [Lentisphaeria bacterium]